MVGHGLAMQGMGLIADRGLEIVLLRVLRNLSRSGSVRRGMVGFGLVWYGKELKTVDRALAIVLLRVLIKRGLVRQRWVWPCEVGLGWVGYGSVR